MRTPLLALGALALALLVPGCAPRQEIYGYHATEDVALQPRAEDAPVEIHDISTDPDTTYEDYRAKLKPNRNLGTFTALNREGTALEPLLPEVRSFIRSIGGDAAILSCAVSDVEGQPRRICAGMALRYEGTEQ